MPPKRKKINNKKKKGRCEEEITDEERLELLGIYKDDEGEETLTYYGQNKKF